MQQQALNSTPTVAPGSIQKIEKVVDPAKKAAALERYSKLGVQIKGYLKGRGYHKAMEAYDFAKQYHVEVNNKQEHLRVRKDGYTPEFQHQIEIALFITTLKELRDEETTLIAAFLHDVREDYHIAHDVIEAKFGKVAADAVEKLTKEFKGVKKDMQDYFDKIAQCPIASIVKLADRINNVSSMVGVFTIKKQEDYLVEIKTYFLPLIKVVRDRFPDQSQSYHGMSTFIKNMSVTIEAVLKAEKKLLTQDVAQEAAPVKPKF